MWLGEKNDRDDRERFPDGALNEKQLRCLFSFVHPGVIGLWVGPALAKLTSDNIVEIAVDFSGEDHGYIWLADDGEVVATAHRLPQEGKNRPFGYSVEGFMWQKGQSHSRSEAERGCWKHGFWSLGNSGAVPEIREFIHEHWVSKDDDDPLSAEELREEFVNMEVGSILVPEQLHGLEIERHADHWTLWDHGEKEQYQNIDALMEAI